MSELLVEFLKGRDAACPRCGYSLRDLESDWCPECGDALVLRVGLEHPRLAWFIAGLIGLSTGFGFHGVMSIWAVIYILKDGWRASQDWVMVWMWIWAVVFGGLLFAWIRWRHRIGARTVRTRWMMAAVTIVFGAGVPFTLFVVAG